MMKDNKAINERYEITCLYGYLTKSTGYLMGKHSLLAQCDCFLLALSLAEIIFYFLHELAAKARALNIICLLY